MLPAPLSDPGVRLSRTRLFVEVTGGGSASTDPLLEAPRMRLVVQRVEELADTRIEHRVHAPRELTRRSRRVASFTRGRSLCSVCQLSVWRLANSPRAPSTPAPSLHRLVAFGGFIGTMSRSDSRLQLGTPLRCKRCDVPPSRTSRGTRSGLLGSDGRLPYVMRSLTPAECHCSRRWCWRAGHAAFGFRNSLGLRVSLPFEAHYPHPIRPLSTLRPRRYRRTRKTRFCPVC